MLKSLIQLAFELQDVAQTANRTRAFRIDLNSLGILNEGFLNLRICLEQVAFHLVRPLVVRIHTEDLVTDLHTVVLSATFTLKQCQQYPVFHDVISKLNCLI